MGGFRREIEIEKEERPWKRREREGVWKWEEANLRERVGGERL